jgi:hypothetical protein
VCISCYPGFGSSPTPLPLSHSQVSFFLSHPQSSLLGVWGRGRSQIIRRRDSIVLYKSFNPLCGRNTIASQKKNNRWPGNLGNKGDNRNLSIWKKLAVKKGKSALGSNDLDFFRNPISFKWFLYGLEIPWLNLKRQFLKYGILPADITFILQKK